MGRAIKYTKLLEEIRTAVTRNVFIIHGEGYTAGVVPVLRSKGIEVTVATTRGHKSRAPFEAVLQPGTMNLYSTEARFGVIPATFERHFRPATKRDIDALAPSASASLQMLDRMNLVNYSVSELRRLYLRLIGFWRSLLDLHQPEAIVINSVPQFGFDNVVYQLARADGRKTLLFRNTYIEDRVMVAQAIEDVLGPTPAEIDAAAPSAPEAFASPSNQQLNEMMMDLSVIRQKLSRRGVLRTLTGIKQFSRLAPDPDFLYDPTPRIGWVRWQNFKGRLLCRRCLQRYDQISQLPSLDEPFVYFPLHTEPEEGTMPLGGSFVDSLHVIETISAALPAGWRLYVKEHPNQFNRKFLMSKGRNLRFYDALAKIPRVVPIKIELNGQALIAKAKAIATITGTSGWEALQQGKSTLVFGYAWYLRSPGVIRVDGVDSCARALNRIERGEERVNVDRVGRYLRLMRDQYTVPMIYAEDFVPLSKLSISEHDEAFAAAISQSIEPKGRDALG
jgi:hypothetical protein